MTTYIQERDAVSKTDCWLATLTFDYCANTFGSAPCTATGTKCYNTWPICKDKTNYVKTTKDYEFTTGEVFPGPRPYINKVKFHPTEIKKKSFVHQRVKIQLLDEPDTDVGLDPYLSTRPSVQGDYWKKFIARNRNYKNRLITLKRGFLGNPRSEFKHKFTGRIENIKLLKNGIEIEAISLLKSLANKKVPPKIDCKLVTDIDAVQTTITVTDASLLYDPVGAAKRYFKRGKEIISYTVRNTTTNEVSGGARGEFGTTASSHNKNDKIELVRYYSPQNGFDILNTEMLQADGGISTSYINTTAFSDIKTDPISDIQYQGVISKTVDLDKLCFDLARHLNAVLWENEEGKIDIARPVPNYGDRVYNTITDEANIILDSPATDLKDKDRKTRIIVNWNKAGDGDVDDDESYNRQDISVDADAESVNDLNEEIPEDFYSQWIYEGVETEEDTDNYVRDNFSRMAYRLSHPAPIFTFRTGLKDMDIEVAEVVKVTTNAIQDRHGNPLTGGKALIIKRNPQGDSIIYTAMVLPEVRYMQIAPDSLAGKDWDTATEAEREHGVFCEDNGTIDNEEEYGFSIM